jgi:hypothetical protein
MTALNEKSRALLKVAREDALAPSDKARLRAELTAKLALGLPAEAPRAAPPSPPPASGVSAGLVTGKQIAAGALIGVVAFLGGFLTGKTRIDAPAAPLSVSASPTSTPLATPSALAPKDEPTIPSAHIEARRAAEIVRPVASAVPKAPSLAPPRAADPIAIASAEELSAAAAPTASPGEPTVLSGSAAPPSAQNTLAAEMALLRASQSAVLGGDPARALARLDDLAARYPDGQLREERMAARVLALCAAGRTEEARAEAERLFRAAPRSLHAERVRSSCAFSKKSE